VAAEKNLKRGAAAAGRRKSGFGDLRFGPESPSSPLIRGGGSNSRSGGDGWDRRRGGGGSRGRGGGDGAGEGAAVTEQGWVVVASALPRERKRERRLGVEEERIKG
jgi:hypothetical protein